MALRWQCRTLAGIYLGVKVLEKLGTTHSAFEAARGILARFSAPTQGG